MAEIDSDDSQVLKQAEQFKKAYAAVRQQMTKVIVGQDDVVDGVLTCLFAGGHALLEGVPGLGKTLLVRSLSEALALNFSRVQFTPDLMPADITGTIVVAESETEHGQRRFQFQRGPVFAQIVLADEINRATPKTQSALLEAMQDRSVTVGNTTYPMAKPFLVMATQNPIEQEGTYPLPEAQLDRFFFKLDVGGMSRQELHVILDRTTSSSQPKIEPVLDGESIQQFQQLVRKVLIAPHVQDYAIRCTLATHSEGEFACKLSKQFVRYGASPRAAQTLVLAAKVHALRDDRSHVCSQDIAKVLLPAMRHRIVMNFEGHAEGITTDMILREIQNTLPLDADMKDS